MNLLLNSSRFCLNGYAQGELPQTDGSTSNYLLRPLEIILTQLMRRRLPLTNRQIQRRCSSSICISTFKSLGTDSSLDRIGKLKQGNQSAVRPSRPICRPIRQGMTHVNPQGQASDLFSSLDRPRFDGPDRQNHSP
jgi:hypothetical protein